MRPVVLGIIVSAGILAPCAAGQCRLDPWNFGVAAFDHGRAIVSSVVNTQGIPIVHFLDKSAGGWQTGSAFVLGDLQMLYPSPVAIDSSMWPR